MVGLGSVAVSVVFASVPVLFEASSTLMVHVVIFGLPLTLIAPLVVLASFGWVLPTSVSVAETWAVLWTLIGCAAVVVELGYVVVLAVVASVTVFC